MDMEYWNQILQGRMPQLGNDWIPTARSRQQATDNLYRQQQSDFQNQVTEAGLTGQYQGQPTFQREQWQDQVSHRNEAFDWQKTLQEAGLTGMYNDAPTWQRTLETAGLTGMFEGSPTWQRQYQQQQLAQQASAQRASQGLARERFEWEKEQATLRQQLAENEMNPDIANAAFNALEGLQTGTMSYDEISQRVNNMLRSGMITDKEAQFMMQSISEFNNPTVAPSNSIAAAGGRPSGQPDTVFRTNDGILGAGYMNQLPQNNISPNQREVMERHLLNLNR